MKLAPLCTALAAGALLLMSVHQPQTTGASWTLGSSVQAQESRGPLILLEEDEPQTPYPFLAQTMSEQRLAELLFDRFFTISPGGDVDSRIFEQGWSARGSNLTTTVRDSLLFSNGETATFADVAYSMNQIYRQSSNGHRSAAWYARVFGEAQQITPQAGSIRYLVPMPNEGSERYLVTTALLSRAALEEGAGASGLDLSGSKRLPVGTGPFHAATSIENFDDVTLLRNPHRLPPSTGAMEARADRQPVDSVRLLYDQDSARQRELMEGSRAHVWVSPPPAVLPIFRNQSERFRDRAYDLKQWWYVAVNPTNPHLGNPAVRAALDHTIARGDLAAKLGADSVRLTSGPFLPGSAWTPADVTATEESRDLARSRMETAGYVMEGGRWMVGGEPVELRLGVQSDMVDDYNDVVYGLTDAWEDSGFRVRVRSIRPSDWRALVEQGNAGESFDLILGRWNLDREEGALELFRSPTSSNGLNLFGYANTGVDELIGQFYQETSGPAREALMQRLHRTLHEDRPYLFLWTLQVQSIYRRDMLAGFRPSSFYYYSNIEDAAWKADAP